MSEWETLDLVPHTEPWWITNSCFQNNRTQSQKAPATLAYAIQHGIFSWWTENNLANFPFEILSNKVASQHLSNVYLKKMSII